MNALLEIRRRQGIGTLVLGLAAVFALLAAAACGDGGGDGDDGGTSTVPATSVTPIDPELQALLQSMVLAPEDLPSGLEQAGLFFSTNEGIAESAADPEAELMKLERLGRRLAIDVNFTPTGAAPPDFAVRGGVQNTVSLYTAAEGASESFQEGVAGARQTDWPSRYPELQDVVMKEIDEQLGDESAWFRITGTDGSGLFVVDDQVVFRVGPARSFLRVVSAFDEGAGQDVYIDEVAGWARVVAERIERELELSATGDPAG